MDTGDTAFRTLLLCMASHICTKHFSLTVERTVQLHIGTAFIVSGREMVTTLTDLQHRLAPIFLVGAVHLQLSYLSALLLQEHVREVSAATVRAGIVILRPLVKTAFTEVSFTAVDQMRLTQDFHTNRTC